jgi:hypothetical protein
LRAELARHAGNVRQHLAFHDTEMFGDCGEDGMPGLNYAIADFLSAHPEWQECYRSTANNGLTILERG